MCKNILKFRFKDILLNRYVCQHCVAKLANVFPCYVLSIHIIDGNCIFSSKLANVPLRPNAGKRSPLKSGGLNKHLFGVSCLGHSLSRALFRNSLSGVWDEGSRSVPCWSCFSDLLGSRDFSIEKPILLKLHFGNAVSSFLLSDRSDKVFKIHRFYILSVF